MLRIALCWAFEAVLLGS
jgi:hypothetical protein